MATAFLVAVIQFFCNKEKEKEEVDFSFFSLGEKSYLLLRKLRVACLEQVDRHYISFIPLFKYLIRGSLLQIFLYQY
ncbi:hypothetical protein DFP96_10679 [Listeria rocourtiae]|uniref:Uncharacterized protein n=1 Tax=Listeria rocourtiae TaxID=647910 RepID=A0A4R6ZKI7_9LIST|nr:hypothetical protein PROCOU_02769 [Listeria rocourtiae FSL F6-920]TDR52873.1 hypothetical protein DFP96_10679 [Listeria rocourtiae]